MSDDIDFDALFELARQQFDSLLEEFAFYQVVVEPKPLLVRTDGMYSFYDMQTGHINIALPDLTTPMGIFHKLFMQAMWRCEAGEDLLFLLRLWVSYVVSHELAHCLRDRFGQFSTNLWYEEQIANQLAAAAVKRRLSPEEKARAMAIVQRAIAALAPKVEAKHIAADSYFDVLDALGTQGGLSWPVDNLQVIQRALSIPPEAMLKSSGELSEDQVQRLERRQDIIDSFNEAYTSNVTLYMYYHLGWLSCELASRETRYVEEFVRLHLGCRVDLLPPITVVSIPQEGEILACYRAYLETLPISDVASRYFYKRYRSLLLARLHATEVSDVRAADPMKQEVDRMLETWQDEEPDLLVFVEQVVPPIMRNLLPNRIEACLNAQSQANLEADLTAETDKRLWRAALRRGDDPAAAATLERLALLERSTILRSLPAEVLLELAHTIISVRLEPGETLIWEGDNSNDIYILSTGTLEVSKQGKYLASIAPGEVVGEIAFFTREVRSATVRAGTRSQCFVLKTSEFQLIGFRHPSVFIQVARCLADRLLELRSGAASQGTEVR